MKPHPSIFEAALRLIGVPAAEAVMVGDSLTHDIEGATRRACARLSCSAAPRTSHPDVPATLIERPGVRIVRLAARSCRRLQDDCGVSLSGGVRRDRSEAARDATASTPAASRAPRPASRCRWMWNTVWPASRLQLKTVR